jgi:hypothetical protein
VPKPTGTPSALQYWRKVADRAAVQKGAKRACGLCKRAMMGMGRVELRPPWPTQRPVRRWICLEHWKALTLAIEKMEYELDNYDMPTDVTAKGITTGGGLRGRHIKR